MTVKTLSELQAGEALPNIELKPVSRLDLIKYAGASGDYNPIHTIDEEATKAGLPGIIAHGMWTMGNLAKLFTPFYHEGFVKEYKIRFKGMVFLEDVITLKAVAKERTIDGLYFKVEAVNQNEKPVLVGNVLFGLYE